MAHLDHREKGGYTQHSVQFYPRQAENGMPSEGVTGMIFKRNFNQEIKDVFFMRRRIIILLYIQGRYMAASSEQKGRKEEANATQTKSFDM